MEIDTSNRPVTAPFLSSVFHVADEIATPDGRPNAAYFFDIFGTGLRQYNASYGLTNQFIRTNGKSSFVAEVHLRYLAPLNRGEDVQVGLMLVDLDDRRQHIFEQLIDRHHKIIATREQIQLCVDLATRKVTTWPEPLARNLARIRAAHSALPMPEGLGRCVGMQQHA